MEFIYFKEYIEEKDKDKDCYFRGNENKIIKGNNYIFINFIIKNCLRKFWRNNYIYLYWFFVCIVKEGCKF